MELTAEAVAELLREDVRARKELAELPTSEPETRLAIINAVLRDVATRGRPREAEGVSGEQV